MLVSLEKKHKTNHKRLQEKMHIPLNINLNFSHTSSIFHLNYVYWIGNGSLLLMDSFISFLGTVSLFCTVLHY